MKITADGNYKVTASHNTDSTVVCASGNLGGATAQLTYIDKDRNYIPFVDGTLEVGQQYRVDHGLQIDIFVTVTGATGATDFNVTSGGRK